jgi:hypothetical protein
MAFGPPGRSLAQTERRDRHGLPGRLVQRGRRIEDPGRRAGRGVDRPRRLRDAPPEFLVLGRKASAVRHLSDLPHLRIGDVDRQTCHRPLGITNDPRHLARRPAEAAA